MDKLTEKKKEALAYLEKIHAEVCNLPEALKDEVTKLQDKIREDENDCFEEEDGELDEIMTRIDTLLIPIHDDFEESKLGVQSCQEETVPWSIVTAFQKKKSDLRQNMFSLQTKLREITKTYFKKKKENQKLQKQKNDFLRLMQNGVDDITKLTEEIQGDMQSALAENMQNAANLKIALDPVKKAVDRLLDNLKRDLEVAQIEIEETDDSNTNKNSLRDFQKKVNSTRMEIHSEKDKMRISMYEYSPKVIAANHERDMKIKTVLHKLKRFNDAKQEVVAKFQKELFAWISKVDKELLESDTDVSHKLDELKIGLEEIIEDFEEKFEEYKSQILNSENIQYANECLLAFKTSMSSTDNEIRKLKSSFHEIKDWYSKCTSQRHEEQAKKIVSKKEGIEKLCSETQKSVNDIEKEIERNTSTIQGEQMSKIVQEVKSKFENRRSEFYSDLNSVLRKVDEMDPDNLQIYQVLLSEVISKKTIFDGILKCIRTEISELTTIREKRQQQHQKDVMALEKLYTDVSVLGKDLITEIEQAIVESNEIEKSSLEPVITHLKSILSDLDKYFGSAQSGLEVCKYNSQGKDSQKFLDQSVKIESQIKVCYEKFRDVKSKNLEKRKLRQKKSNSSLEKEWSKLKEKVEDLQEQLEQLKPLTVDGSRCENQKWNRLNTSIGRIKCEMEGDHQETKKRMSEHILDSSFQEDILTSFQQDRIRFDEELDNISKELQVMNQNSSKISKFQQEKHATIQKVSQLNDEIKCHSEALMNFFVSHRAGSECPDFERKRKEIINELTTEFNEIKCFFDETNSKIQTLKHDESFTHEILLKNYEKKLNSIRDKIASLKESFDSAQVSLTKKEDSRTEILDKLRCHYETMSVSANYLHQNITNVISGENDDGFIDKEDMHKDLDKVKSELERIKQELTDLFNQKKREIESSQDIYHRYDQYMRFQTESVPIKSSLDGTQRRFKEISERYNISPEAVLARCILSESKQRGSQLEDVNNLRIFKLPLEQKHSIPVEKLRRFELGDECKERYHRHLILVGMTGSGKSLLVNNMINYIYGVKLTDNFRFKLIVEDDEIGEREAGASKSRAESMTSWVSSFTLNWQEGFRIPFSLTIIDTPGFGDTRGLKYDEIIVDQIRTFFNDDDLCPNQEMSSIGLLIQASQSRITEEQKYIFDQVLNLFGNDMKDNISLIFTFADAQEPPALEVVRSNNIPYKETFKFNNSAIYAPNTDELAQFSWDFGYSNLQNYFDALSSASPISLKLTKTVLDERERLRVILGSLQQRISNGMETLRLIEEQSHVIANLEGTIKSNKGFKVKKQTHNCELKVVKHHITNCSKCNFTCHDPCNIEGDNKKGCASMRSGLCVACPSQCPWDMHTNGTNVYVYTPVEVEETIEDMMRQYNVAIGKKDAKKKLLYEMLVKYRSQKDEVFHFIEEANNCSNRLEDISLRCSYLTNVEYIERLIQSEERSSTRPHKKDRLNQLRHLKDMAETLKAIKGNPEELPNCVSNYESRIIEIIETVQEEDDDENEDDEVESNDGNKKKTVYTHLKNALNFFGKSKKSKNEMTSV